MVIKVYIVKGYYSTCIVKIKWIFYNICIDNFGGVSMDKREELKSIIKNTISIPYGKIHYYPNISDKIKSKITKNFDANINTNNIVAFIDSSLMGTSKIGLVFTLTGIYNLEVLSKPYYFNYKDIEDMTVICDKKGRYNSEQATLEIKLSNGKVIEVGYGNFYKDNLKNLFQE